MTANSTPRLGLMAPVDSDLFLSSDFNTTFTKLDAVPGTTIVANYAALTALSWTSAQYGSKAIQLDNRAEWMWVTPGSWVRTNNIGELAYATQSAPITTIVTTAGGGPTFITTGNFTAPGGRNLRVHLNMGLSNSASQTGIAIITIYDNGTQIDEFNYRAGALINNQGNNQHAFSRIVPANNSTHNISAKQRSAISTAPGGGGSTLTAASRLQVIEV